MENKCLDSFESITVNEPFINNSSVSSLIEIHLLTGEKISFKLQLSYETKIDIQHLPILRLAFSIPLLNYGLFTHKFILQFPLARADLDLLQKMNYIFSRDIFVNKILRRRANYILPEYLPDLNSVTDEHAKPKTRILPLKIENNIKMVKSLNPNICGILSSGGKESLLTYGLLNEIGTSVYPLYVNESGGHWRTSLTAYRYHKKHDKKTQRVWTNIDRFYTFMLDHLPFIRPDHRTIIADTYPIRLCIFPFYVFALLPLYQKYNIGNLLIGSEFDDIRSPPKYLGIRHYYGVYDQHQDYDHLMNRWYNQRLPGMVQWSALRQISGLIVERILVDRYPYLAALQRSCHSCHFEKNDLIPCGQCSKCQGVLLFLKANKTDPTIMKFPLNTISSFVEQIQPSKLRLDEDEKNHSLYQISSQLFPSAAWIDHIESIHIDTSIADITIIPPQFRTALLDIIGKYTTSQSHLKNEKWIVDKFLSDLGD
jgi:hypothetical protein